MSKFEIWAELWPRSWLGRVMAKGLVVQTKYLEQGCNTLIFFCVPFGCYCQALISAGEEIKILNPRSFSNRRGNL